MIRPAVLTICIVFVAGPASAQASPDDWEFIDQQNVRAARVQFDSGLSVVVRCQDAGLETYIVGLPVDPEVELGRRTIDYAFGDAALRPSTWQTSENGRGIFADVPAPLARRFRAGGELQLRLPGREGRPSQRYVVRLPTSESSIDRVLTACGRPVEEARDALRRDERSDAPDEASSSAPTWRQLPRPSYPEPALRRRVSGMAVLSCLVQEGGRLDACQVEVERPMGAGFGAAALRSARDARLDAQGEASATASGGLITFTTRFQTR